MVFRIDQNVKAHEFPKEEDTQVSHLFGHVGPQVVGLHRNPCCFLTVIFSYSDLDQGHTQMHPKLLSLLHVY